MPRDLHRCRSTVRRLSRDLPTFDSVWIDALVQNRRLTPYQSNCLESSTPDRLVAGPYVIVDRLGSDGRFGHFEARMRADGRKVMVSLLEQPLPTPGMALEWLQALVQRTQPLSHPGLQEYVGCGVEQSTIGVIGSWVTGARLHELLVRRGRFAPVVVQALCRQMVDALAALESLGFVHGDIRVRKIQLSPRGQCVLLHPGLSAAIAPEVTIHAGLPPDAFDAVAPERIGTGRLADTASEMYALGCVLWELLAGRPPFPQGDPLAKLAAHQSRSVPDIRTWAPDTPAELASLIRSLTDRNAQARPASFGELGRALRGNNGAVRRQLRSFHGSFRRLAASGSQAAAARTATRRYMVAALVVLVSACVGLFHSGARSHLLRIAPGLVRPPPASRGADGVREHVDGARLQRSDRTARLPFPTRVEHGVLLLEHPGPYNAGAVAAAGTLRVRGTASTRSVILVGDRPLQIWAEQLILENLEVRFDPEGGDQRRQGAARPGSLLVVEAQSLAARHCTLVTTDEEDVAAIVWSPLDPDAAGPQRLWIAESLFIGAGASVRAMGQPGTLAADCVLKLGTGPFLEFAPSPGTIPSGEVRLRQTTLRDAGSVVRIVWPAGERSEFQLPLSFEDCVLDISRNASALVEFVADTIPSDWQRRLRIGGENSLIRPGTPIATRKSPAGAGIEDLDADRVAIDGLLAENFDFDGPADGVVRNSAVSRYRGHGRSLEPPGIDPRRFPEHRDDGYNSQSGDQVQAPPRHAVREP